MADMTFMVNTIAEVAAFLGLTKQDLIWTADDEATAKSSMGVLFCEPSKTSDENFKDPEEYALQSYLFMFQMQQVTSSSAGSYPCSHITPFKASESGSFTWETPIYPTGRVMAADLDVNHTMNEQPLVKTSDDENLHDRSSLSGELDMEACESVNKALRDNDHDTNYEIFETLLRIFNEELTSCLRTPLSEDMLQKKKFKCSVDTLSPKTPNLSHRNKSMQEFREVATTGQSYACCRLRNTYRRRKATGMGDLLCQPFSVLKAAFDGGMTVDGINESLKKLSPRPSPTLLKYDLRKKESSCTGNRQFSLSGKRIFACTEIVTEGKGLVTVIRTADP